LIACKECNSDFKRNHFPIENEDNRVSVPPVEDRENGYTDFMKSCRIDSPNLKNEKPLLLHPVLDNPDEHLVFDKEGGVSAKNGSLKGQKSIEHYGLDNWEKRSILITDRGCIIEKVRNDVRTAVLNANDDKQLYKSILTIIIYLLEDLEIRKSNEKHVIQPHSAVRKACISQFESFFIDCETCYTEEQKGKLRDVLMKIR
jgi:hypothetical protein